MIGVMSNKKKSKKENKQFYSKKNLKDLGWTEKMMEKCLPAPIQQKTSKTSFRYVWRAEDVIAATKTDKFKKMQKNADNARTKQQIKQLHPVLSALPKTMPELYPAARLMKRHFVLHIGPTNSGKTYDAKKRLINASDGIYLGPLRLLAYEVCMDLREKGVHCSLITGEEEDLDPESTVQSSTIEMANMSKEYDVAVIDEAQMIADIERGGNWTKAILGLCAEEIHVCMAPEAEFIVTELIRSCNDTFEVVRHKRFVPLVAETDEFIFPDNVKKGDALIVFSRKDVHACAAELKSENILCSIIYGNLPYDVRHREAEKFANGESDVIVATDAIGMGMNLPIKRVVFLRTTKYDGIERRELRPEEVRQIAGRAGRYGIYDTGYYAATKMDYSSNIKDLYVQNTKMIDKVVIGFPDTLLDIPEPISSTILNWQKIELPKGFVRQNLDQMYKLVKELERVTDDKKFIFQFASIPFDENCASVYMLWQDIYRNELNGIFYQFVPINITNLNLEALEEVYKTYDLLGNYYRKFGTYEDICKVLAEKLKVSKAISKILDKQEYKAKTCKVCGKRLSLFYPYTICQKCYLEGQIFGFYSKERKF